MRLQISPILIALPLLAGLGACADSKQEVGGKPRTGPLVHGYVSLSPSTTELIIAAGVPQSRLAGITAACNYPGGFKDTPIVLTGTTPDFEKIVAAGPERVIVEKDLFSEPTIQKLKDLGLEVLVVDTDTPAGYEETVTKVAKDSGTETLASKYLDQVHGSESLMKGSIPEGEKLIVLIGDATTGYMAMGSNMLLSNFIKESPGKYVGPDSSKFVLVSAEQLLAFSPDIIITQIGQGEGMLRDPQLKTVPAIANGRILAVESDILLRNGGRVDKLLEGVATGVSRLARSKGN